MSEKKGVLIIGILIVVLLSLYLFSFKPIDLTGYASGVEGGKSTKLDDQEKLNPTKGILKGIVKYTIKDNNVVVNKEPAANITVYFVTTGNQFTNYSKVKIGSDDDDDYKEVKSIDSDDSGSECSTSDYKSKTNYYDTNDNNERDGDEFKLYTVTTDSKGCYAIKLKADSYDIYV